MKTQKHSSFGKSAMLQHSIVECEIERLGVNGEGISSVDGITLFIKDALIGEKVRVRITNVSEKYIEGKILDRITHSPDRVKPFCELYGRCGGCTLMHLANHAQLKYKKQRVSDELSKVGIRWDGTVNDCIPSPFLRNYRNKIEMPFRMRDRNRTFGFFREGSHEIIRVESCPVHLREGEIAYRVVREAVLESGIAPYDEHRHSKGLRHLIIRTSDKSGMAQVVLITNKIEQATLKKLAENIISRSEKIAGVFYSENNNKGNVILGKTVIHLAGSKTLTINIGKWIYETGPASFFQVNPAQANIMVNKVLELADIKSNDCVVDAYCGTGFFSIPLATKAAEVIGIEEVDEAVALAVRNAVHNEATNVRFICGASEEIITSIDNFSIALVDPPRKGCAESFLHAIIKKGIQKFIYVSCNPATLARDLKIMIQGGYSLKIVQPLDMFPQTPHVECIAVMVKN